MDNNLDDRTITIELDEPDSTPSSIYIQSEPKPRINSSTENINNDHLMLLAAAAVNSSPNDDRYKVSENSSHHNNSNHFIHSPPIIRVNPASPDNAIESNYNGDIRQNFQTSDNLNSSEWADRDVFVRNNNPVQSSSRIKKHMSVKRPAPSDNGNQSGSMSVTDRQACKRWKSHKRNVNTASSDEVTDSTSNLLFYLNNSNDDDNDSSTELNLYNNAIENSNHVVNIDSIRSSSSLFRPITDTNNDSIETANSNPSKHSKRSTVSSQSSNDNNNTNNVAGSSSSSTSTNTNNNSYDNSESNSILEPSDRHNIRNHHHSHSLPRSCLTCGSVTNLSEIDRGSRISYMNERRRLSNIPYLRSVSTRNSMPSDSPSNNTRSNTTVLSNVTNNDTSTSGRGNLRTHVSSFLRSILPQMHRTSNSNQTSNLESPSISSPIANSTSSASYRNTNNANANQIRDPAQVRSIRLHCPPYLTRQDFPPYTHNRHQLCRQHSHNCRYIRNHVVDPDEWYINDRIPHLFQTSSPPTYSYNNIPASHSSFSPYRRRRLLNYNASLMSSVDFSDMTRTDSSNDSVPTNNNNDDATSTTTTTTTSDNSNRGNNSGQVNNNDLPASSSANVLDTSLNNFLRAFGLDEIRQRQRLEQISIPNNNDDYMPDLMLPMFPFDDGNLFNLNSNVEQVIQMALHLESSSLWKGINNEELNLIPTTKYKQPSSNSGSNKPSEPNDKLVQDKCIICLAEFVDGESLRTLCCKHQFHVLCVDTWLKMNRTCPMCRADALVGKWQSNSVII